jgi:parallel beta-helix repeat protein
MRAWGILFSQVPHDNHTSGLRALALDNVINDIDEAKSTNGTSKGGIWSGGAQATIVGNRIRRIGWDGIETVGTSDGVWIAANRISETKTGIYLEHATTHSVIRNNTISDVDTGIIVEWLYDGVGSTDNHFIANRVKHSRVGIFVDFGSDRNVLQHNIFSYGSRPTIILQGASNNLVLDNQACGAAGAVVGEQYADPGTGAVLGKGNVIQRNRSLPTCDE